MDDPELQNSNEEWDEPMSPTPDDRTSVDGPASPDPMSPDNSGYLGRPRVYDNAGGTPDDPMSPDDFGGEEPMSPDNNFRNYNRPTSPGYPMSPENGACSESSTRSEDQGRLRGPATPDGPASPDGPYPRSPEYNPLSPKLPNENADNPRSPDDLASSLGPRSPYDYNSQDGPRSPYPSNSSISPGRSVSQGGYASHGDPQSPDFASQDNPRSPSFGPASPDGPRSPDELGQFDGPRSPDYPSIPDGPMSPDDFIRSDRPQSPDELALRSGPRSPEEHASFQGSASINGSRTFDGQSSMEGPRTPEFPISPRFGMAPDDPVLAGNSLDRRGPMTPDDRASSTGYTGPRTPDFPISPRFGMTSDGRALAGNSLDRRGLMTPDDHASSTGYTESQSMRSPAPSTARSPVDSADQRNDQDDRLSEISEGDSALNVGSGSESEENEEDKDKEQNEETLEKMDTKNKSKRRSDDSLGLKDELDFEAERESGEEDGEEGEEGEDDETPVKKRDIENREDGELSDEEDDDALLRQEPKTVCRFFNKGQCTWGTNCRFLHPGVSDKGNYNMFAPAKPQASNEKEEETTTERERPREVRRYIPEPSPFESAWERGLRYAKEMMKRANKRKETDADFEEKRFNLSLGQAELDRENDYYTRPASPVYKQPDEITDQYLDPFEKQAIRHFRGGHFENFEVRYHVDPRYNMRGGGHDRSRREKYEREVSERTHRRSRQAGPPGEERNRIWQDDRYMEVLTSGGGARGEAEAWADPWARRKTPPRSGRKKKTSRTRSYSTGSSSRSSSSSHSRSRSGSKSSRTTVASRSSKSRSSSRSPSPGHRRGNHRLGPGNELDLQKGENTARIYIGSLEVDLTACLQRNTHNHTKQHIQKIINAWQPSPVSCNKVDLTPLAQDAAIEEVEMEDSMDMAGKDDKHNQKEEKNSGKKEEVEDDDERGSFLKVSGRGGFGVRGRGGFGNRGNFGDRGSDAQFNQEGSFRNFGKGTGSRGNFHRGGGRGDSNRGIGSGNILRGGGRGDFTRVGGNRDDFGRGSQSLEDMDVETDQNPSGGFNLRDSQRGSGRFGGARGGIGGLGRGDALGGNSQRDDDDDNDTPLRMGTLQALQGLSRGGSNLGRGSSFNNTRGGVSQDKTMNVNRGNVNQSQNMPSNRGAFSQGQNIPGNRIAFNQFQNMSGSRGGVNQGLSNSRGGLNQSQKLPGQGGFQNMGKGPNNQSSNNNDDDDDDDGPAVIGTLQALRGLGRGNKEGGASPGSFGRDRGFSGGRGRGTNEKDGSPGRFGRDKGNELSDGSSGGLGRGRGSNTGIDMSGGRGRGGNETSASPGGFGRGRGIEKGDGKPGGRGRGSNDFDTSPGRFGRGMPIGRALGNNDMNTSSEGFGRGSNMPGGRGRGGSETNASPAAIGQGKDNSQYNTMKGKSNTESNDMETSSEDTEQNKEISPGGRGRGGLLSASSFGTFGRGRGNTSSANSIAGRGRGGIFQTGNSQGGISSGRNNTQMGSNTPGEKGKDPNKDAANTSTNKGSLQKGNINQSTSSQVKTDKEMGQDDKPKSSQLNAARGGPGLLGKSPNEPGNPLGTKQESNITRGLSRSGTLQGLRGLGHGGLSSSSNTSGNADSSGNKNNNQTPSVSSARGGHSGMSGGRGSSNQSSARGGLLKRNNIPLDKKDNKHDGTNPSSAGSSTLGGDKNEKKTDSTKDGTTNKGPTSVNTNKQDTGNKKSGQDDNVIAKGPQNKDAKGASASQSAPVPSNVGHGGIVSSTSAPGGVGHGGNDLQPLMSLNRGRGIGNTGSINTGPGLMNQNNLLQNAVGRGLAAWTNMNVGRGLFNMNQGNVSWSNIGAASRGGSVRGNYSYAILGLLGRGFNARGQNFR